MQVKYPIKHGIQRSDFKAHLQQVIEQRISTYGNNADLNDLDVSNVKDMSRLFENSEFTGDISGWDVSNVKDMSEDVL